MTEAFVCPHCRLPLDRGGGRFFCPSGHSFDLAAEGYVNLLLPGQAHSKVPGDSREMVASRRAFLHTGHYDPFRKHICNAAAELALRGSCGIAVDAGCGEGYYTSALADTLTGAGCPLYAFDISKFAVKAAAKAYKNVSFAVASCADMPFADESVRLLVNVFAPLEPAEVCRVLVNGGYLLYAVPSPRHLFGLKSLLYDAPYENPREDTDYAGLYFVRRESIHSTVILTSHTDIMNLFSMTPYYWRSPRKGTERLGALDTLETEIGFELLIYRKSGGV